MKVLSQRPAFHSLMLLSAEPESMRPCSGRMSTAHTAAEWPCGAETGVRAQPPTTHPRPTYLQGHHALFAQPDFGCGVPGTTEQSSKLPGRQRADCSKDNRGEMSLLGFHGNHRGGGQGSGSPVFL